MVLRQPTVPRVLLAALLIALVALPALAAPPAGAATDALRWAPPELVNPTTIRLGQGYTSSTLDPAKDYVVELPPYKKTGATVLVGGRNVVIRGGYVSIPPNQPDDAHRRAIYIKNNVGTVHVEGVLIDGSEGGVSDGIDIAAPASTVQIQNVRVVGLQGTQSGFHADVIQPWGGVHELRVDRLTGSSAYQGLYIGPDLGPVSSVDLRRVDLRPTPGPYEGGGHMLWVTRGVSSCTSYPLRLDDVWVTPRAGSGLGRAVWPQIDATIGCRSQLAGGALSFTGLSATGYVREGAPPAGEWVPEGVAGLSYSSPGYVNGDGGDPVVWQPPVVQPPTRPAPPSPSLATTGPWPVTVAPTVIQPATGTTPPAATAAPAPSSSPATTAPTTSQPASTKRAPSACRKPPKRASAKARKRARAACAAAKRADAKRRRAR